MKREPFFRRSARLMHRLGARDGLRACFLLVRSPRTPRQLRIPQLPHPFWIRGGTSDFDAFEQIFVHSEYEFGAWPPHHAMIQRTYAEAIDAGKVPIIIDCGANVGLSSVWFAIRYPRAIVYSVEPEPENFALLRRNVSAYPNVTPVQAGISDRAGRVSLHNPAGTPWAFRTEEDENGEVVTVTIPELLARLPNSAPLIIKIDIEGFETSVFRSNTMWAAGTPLVIFEMHDWLLAWRGTGHAILRCLTERPRDYLMRGENVFAFAHLDHS